MYIRNSLLILILALSGCATYQMPGAGLPVDKLAKSEAAAAGETGRQPRAPFPARIVLARVQAPGYAVTNGACYGDGRYCVVTERDIETGEDVRRLQELPQVAGVDWLSRLQLPQWLDSIDDLRQVAAGQQADILLVYTLDTRFNINGRDLEPLSAIRLALPPSQEGRVTTTATAALIDVQTGFVYGVADATAWRKQNASAWSARKNIRNARSGIEVSAFQSLLAEIEKLWHRTVVTHGR